ncbi:MarR family winged helix-turn-helix transcriptional regulator [Streptomyces sp. NPDC050560]|uniref:MarR family winged helix-turn-helix transcriptional regulator n=1 Tax=Streptomyces sp. NPDC050560 TaxID=3365630 RepID=UPI0037BC6677
MGQEDTPDGDDVAAFLEDLALMAIRHISVRDISFTTASTLGRLDRLGPARLTDLAGAESVAQPSMTQLVQRLERQGLVTRVRDPGDGRVVLVSITDAGRELMRRRRATRVKLLGGLLDGLSEADRQALAEVARLGAGPLRRLVENASAPAADRTG